MKIMKRMGFLFLSMPVVLIMSCDMLSGDKESSPYMYNFIRVPVPSGGITFPTGYDDDDTATVSKSFYISETEVTERLYDIVSEWAVTEKQSGKYYNLYYDHYPYFGEDQYRDVPVHDHYAQRWTDWFGGGWITLDHVHSAQIWCNAFTEWYNEQNNTNLTLVYLDPYGNPLREVQDDYWPAKPDATGFRLPTPEEWELAARWNGSDGTNTVTKTINGINFAEQPIKFTKGNSASGAKDWIGNAEETSKVAFCEYNSGGGGRASQFVKMLQPNALGLYDMSGNVAEMVLRYWEGSNESAVFQGRGGVSASGFLPGGSSFDDLAVGYINVYRHGLRLVRTAE